MAGAGTVEDGAIVERVLRGDTEAFGVLVTRYRTAYGRYAVGLCGDADLAADAMQEAFIRAGGGALERSGAGLGGRDAGPRMSDEIRLLTARLTAEPDSLAFLPLGEALRRRGQLDSALTVALAGVQRYPALADGHDLLARIRTDRAEGDLAFDAWTEALRHDPAHAGALRGLAFLAFRGGDLARAERHLAAALALVPDDASLRAALSRVRASRGESAPAPPPPAPAAGDEGASTACATATWS